MPATLIAVTGLSPAVLTETIWALANDPVRPLVPDTVIVLTTLTGQTRMREQLFGRDDLWHTLRRQILGKNHQTDSRLDFDNTPDRLKVLHRRRGSRRIPLDRMDSLEETEAVGDCLVEEIWSWVGRPDTQVLASISGGFKTMSALMYAAMSVLGGPSDRILHVLVEDPFDGGTKPLFFWPGQPQQTLTTTRPSKKGPPGTLVSARDMQPLLTEVRFPVLRKLFKDYGFRKAPTFTALVERCRESVDAIAGGKPSVRFDSSTESLLVENRAIPLRGRALLVACFLLERAQRGKPHYAHVAEAADDFIAFVRTRKQQRWLGHLLDKYYDGQGATADDITKGLSDFRKQLRSASAAHCIPHLAPERSRIGFDILST
ncbi:MAG: TIGR02584 family CRISPR-associated protein [Verrucomicrobiales bacterium]|nr:TIGR02584 family CRISPR-associated protein [Verrucomicrobiales bacterium]